MKKPNKFNASNKRRQKGKGQARQKAPQQPIHHDRTGQPSERRDVQPCERVAPLAFSERRSRRDEGDQKRQLWERKQAELESRWMLAQSRQAEEQSARQRKRKLAYTVTGTDLAGLLSILAWYLAQGGVHVSAFSLERALPF